MSDLKTSIEKLIVASKNLMNNYNDEYLTAGEEETLHEMKEAIKLVEKASKDANNKEQALDLHIVSGSAKSAYDCDDCDHYPCSLQAVTEDMNKKLEYGVCGDHSKRGD